MSRHYTLNKALAEQADQVRGFIDEPGVYTGKFTAAWYEQSRSGAEGIKFKFIADSGEQANNLAIYTHNGAGEALSGYGLLQAIMACMKQRQLQTRQDTVELYDYDSRGMKKQTKNVYPGLYGPIGLVLTTEDYETRFGIKKQLIIHAAFDPQTRLMAAEILAQADTPVMLEKRIQRLHSKNQWHKSLTGQAQKTPPNSPVSAPQNTIADTDDIPF